jgi:hypothetical protein
MEGHMSLKYKVDDRVIGRNNGALATIVAIEGGEYRVKWDNEALNVVDETGADHCLNLESDLEFADAPAKPKKVRKVAGTPKAKVTVEDSVSSEVHKSLVDEPIAVEKDTRVKLSGRIRNEASKVFVRLMEDTGDFKLVEDRNYQAARDLTKGAWKTLTKEAKKVGLALEIVEVKEPAKRLTKHEREIKVRRLAQLAEARKNLAKARANGTIVRKPKTAAVSPESVVEASVSVDPTTDVTTETVNDNERVDEAA